jgi:hypothetical protein
MREQPYQINPPPPGSSQIHCTTFTPGASVSGIVALKFWLLKFPLNVKKVDITLRFGGRLRRLQLDQHQKQLYPKEQQ